LKEELAKYKPPSETSNVQSQRAELSTNISNPPSILSSIYPPALSQKNTQFQS
jgi:hypothetical protein